eukprot:CAMPEP_0175149992 /NCGR_PEP_ID=MMETSP0087-20121206/17590_1 /TAXON_ID=136419 /ORGANISM="Unknown Unknown, Strain D1" /LENGTH=143 /DNA_ID=CAMNT_0016435823 /DNA_START=32 /DNA_END=460 /DNA_ORIENTATION=-
MGSDGFEKAELKFQKLKGRSLWLFEFPSTFDQNQMEQVKLDLPKVPAVGVVATFKSGDRCFSVIEKSTTESNGMINLFADKKEKHLAPGKPFTRLFRIAEMSSNDTPALVKTQKIDFSQPLGLQASFKPIGYVAPGAPNSRPW